MLTHRSVCDDLFEHGWKMTDSVPFKPFERIQRWTCESEVVFVHVKGDHCIVYRWAGGPVAVRNIIQRGFPLK